jgi:hypothetical protein
MSRVNQSRMALLTFVTVSVASMAGIVAASVLIAAFLTEDETLPSAIRFIATPMPAVAAVLGFLFVARFETGRKGLAALAVLFGSLASLVVLAALGLPGLVLASAAAGGFGVFARRLLDAPPSD